eukprot:4063493-Amphidinium_carterae.1
MVQAGVSDCQELTRREPCNELPLLTCWGTQPGKNTKHAAACHTIMLRTRAHKRGQDWKNKAH